VKVPPLPPGRKVDLPGRGAFPVREAGPDADGMTLLLVHGYTATADLNWFASFEPLASRGHVVAPDLRGHGGAPRVRTRLEDCADDLDALLGVREHRRAVVVGWSMGGAIAQLLWYRHPHRVAGLVLCAAAPDYDIGRSWRDPLRVAARLPLGRAPRAVRLALAKRAWGGRNDDSPLQPWALEELARCDHRRVAQAGLALGRFDSSPWAGRIDVPTAVVVTCRDDIVPPADQRRLAGTIPGASVHEVDAGHGAFIEQPELFVPALLHAVDDVLRRVAANP
jgi:pimeloyl-ACP methyl ester carboxylesterase